MDLHDIAGVFFRWMHVISAAGAIGAVIFMRLVVPSALAELDETTRDQVFLKLRRGLKRIIHPAIGLLLISGIYNALANWPGYANRLPDRRRSSFDPFSGNAWRQNLDED